MLAFLLFCSANKTASERGVVPTHMYGVKLAQTFGAYLISIWAAKRRTHLLARFLFPFRRVKTCGLRRCGVSERGDSLSVITVATFLLHLDWCRGARVHFAYNECMNMKSISVQQFSAQKEITAMLLKMFFLSLYVCAVFAEGPKLVTNDGKLEIHADDVLVFGTSGLASAVRDKQKVMLKRCTPSKDVRCSS